MRRGKDGRLGPPRDGRGTQSRNVDWVVAPGALHNELDGKRATRQEILKALTSLNEKAVAFHKAHFPDMIVTAHACDFRLDPKKDRTSRVAVCEDPILSLRNVGQRFPALALDTDKLLS